MLTEKYAQKDEKGNVLRVPGKGNSIVVPDKHVKDFQKGKQSIDEKYKDTLAIVAKEDEKFGAFLDESVEQNVLDSLYYISPEDLPEKFDACEYKVDGSTIYIDRIELIDWMIKD